MTTESSKRRAPRVAVGATPELAARSFGRAHDDLLVTSFAAFDDEVDLASVEVVEVASGEGMVATVQSVVSAQRAGRPIQLRVTVPEDAADGLSALLRRLDLQIAAVESTAGEPVLGLVPGGSAPVGPEELVFQALRATVVDDVPTADHEPGGAGAGPPAPAQRAAVLPDPLAATSRPRPVPRLVDVLESVQRLRSGRRRQAIVLVTVLIALLALVGLGLLADAAGGLQSVVLPVLVAVLLAAVAGSSYATLLLARQVHVQTGRVERAVLRNRKVVQKRAGSLEKRSAALDKRIAALERAQARSQFTEEYLAALGELGAETSGRVRDLTEALDETRRSP